MTIDREEKPRWAGVTQADCRPTRLKSRNVIRKVRSSLSVAPEPRAKTQVIVELNDESDVDAADKNER